MNTKDIIRFKWVAGLLLAFFSLASIAAAEMPRLQFGIGEVTAVGVDGKIRPLKKGDVLRPGEKMVTGPGAMAQLRIFKQGVVVLKDDSQLELKPSVNGQFGISLDKGLMRTVTRLAYKLGKIDVITPGADIAVQAGDVMTGVGIDKTDKGAIHNQVFDGKVRITSGGKEQIAVIGKVLQIDPVRGVITTIDKVPAAMTLRVPAPSAGARANLAGATTRDVAGTFGNDTTKIAVLRPGAAASARSPVTVAGIVPSVPVRDPGSLSDPRVKVNFDGVKVIDPRISVGSPDDMETVNNALILSIPSSISKTRSFAPVTTTDPVVKSSLDSKATIVTLSPTTSIAGETTLSSTELPGIKLLTYEPVKVIETDPSFNATLTNTIKTTSVTSTTTKTIESTLCATCTKALTLIKR